MTEPKLMCERAGTGAALLDSLTGFDHQPWWACIDLEQLEMSDGECCILGQLYGSYGTALDSLAGENVWNPSDERYKFESEHGFTLDGMVDGVTEAAWQKLRTCWVDIIERRRKS